MLIEVLRSAAGRDAHVPAVIAVGRTISYAECVARAESVAAGLLERGIKRFGCAVQDPIDVVVLLAASSASGSEACVYPRALDAAAVDGLAARLGHETVITDMPLELADAETVAFDELSLPAADLPDPATTPLMILTTGTSGTPKGVRHDWSRLIRAVHRSEHDTGGRWLLAYSVNQFASFQVLLHAFVHRSTVVVPRSSHARDVIETMRESQVTHVSATPTFWRLLVGGQGDELVATGALRQITLGGEAAPDALIVRLKQMFPQARVSHVYAGTEFGSVVSVGDGRSGLPVSVLKRGEDANAQFRVVDGELHVRSRNGMLGYHGGDETQGWHPTGDLVEERDGRLHFVGRTVEIINVGGAKVHPLPIEEIVATVPGVLVAAVYGSPNAITGQIVAVDVVNAPGADQDEVKAAIQSACSALPGPGRPRRIRFVDALEVRGQKVVRRSTEVEA